MTRILVAEDDEFLANAYRVKFTKSGFEVLLAADGQEALDIAHKNHPDLILLDLIMPKMDGFTVLETISRDPQLKKIPVIIASNLGQQEDIEKTKSLGAVDYIIKSDITLEDIVKKIRNHLN